MTTAAGPCTYCISGGLAGWRLGDTLDHLSARADTALYEVKRLGRNRVCIHLATRTANVLPSQDSVEWAVVS